jgi:hypothetical protein
VGFGPWRFESSRPHRWINAAPLTIFPLTGVPGFEPGFTVLETVRIAVNSHPRGVRATAGRIRTAQRAAKRPGSIRDGDEHGFVYQARVYEEARRLSERGLSDYEVGRRLGVARSTVQNWRKRTAPPSRSRLQQLPERFRPKHPDLYAYLLGIYLGDGWVWRASPHSWRLSIYCDGAYPDSIREVGTAIHACDPGTTVRHNRRRDKRVVIVAAMSPLWGLAFPQHGPGKKHERRIELEPWQRDITHAHARQFLRGLIHSDGSRCINEFDTALPSGRIAHYAYPRYFFTNYSADIRRLFCEHCDLVGVRWTQSNARNLSVSHRDSVAFLDSFIGPKS